MPRSRTTRSPGPGRLHTHRAHFSGPRGEHDLGVSPATLRLTKNWLPATEVHGEGIFLQLDDALVKKWEERPAVQLREEELHAGFKVWASRFVDEMVRPRFPGIRYLLHSLTHLLITAISLECGYAASAIRERIYCAPSNDPYIPMAAILLSTGSPGTEALMCVQPMSSQPRRAARR